MGIWGYLPIFPFSQESDMRKKQYVCLICGRDVEDGRNERKRTYCNSHSGAGRHHFSQIIARIRKSCLNPRAVAFEAGITMRHGGLK